MPRQHDGERADERLCPPAGWSAERQRLFELLWARQNPNALAAYRIALLGTEARWRSDRQIAVFVDTANALSEDAARAAVDAVARA